MGNTYIKLPITGGGGTGGSSDDVTNESNVSGATVTNALNTLDSDVTSVEIESANTQYVPQSSVVLTAGHIFNKKIFLSDTPTDIDKTTLTISGGVAQTYGIDFEVTGNELSWDGLALDGELEVGDILIIAFN